MESIWHQHTETPAGDGPSSGLIAMRDLEGQWFVLGVFMWRNGQWLDEDTDKPMRIMLVRRGGSAAVASGVNPVKRHLGMRAPRASGGADGVCIPAAHAKPVTPKSRDMVRRLALAFRQAAAKSRPRGTPFSPHPISQPNPEQTMLTSIAGEIERMPQTIAELERMR